MELPHVTIQVLLLEEGLRYTRFTGLELVGVATEILYATVKFVSAQTFPVRVIIKPDS